MNARAWHNIHVAVITVTAQTAMMTKMKRTKLY